MRRLCFLMLFMLCLISTSLLAQIGDKMYTPEQIKSNSAQYFIEKMSAIEPGYQQFAALNALIEKAKGSDANTRRSIISMIEATISDNNKPHNQRWQCCNALGYIGDEKVVPFLAQVIQDKRSNIGGFAAEALGRLYKDTHNAAARDVLLNAARDNPSIQDIVVRYVGETVIAKDGYPAPAARDFEYTQEQAMSIPTEIFLRRLLYPEPNCDTFAAMKALIEKAKRSDEVAREQMMAQIIAAMLNKQAPASQRWQCCYVISDSGYEPGIPYLVKVLSDERDETMRAVAAEALGKLSKNKTAYDALVQSSQKETSEQVLQTIAKYTSKKVSTASPSSAPTSDGGVEDLAPSGPPKPPPGPAKPVAKPLPWPFPGGQEAQNIFNNYQQATDIYIHCGLDFIQPAGTPVTAVGPGYVAAIFTNYPEWKTHYFFIVTPVKGGNRGWCYTHVDPDTYTFKIGDSIQQGQQLGSLVDFSVGDKPGAAHLHLHYVSFTRDASGKVDAHSLLDPLYFFDWKDAIPPSFQSLYFVPDGTIQPFQADFSSLITVSGRVEILTAIADSAYPEHMGNLGVPVVMLSISDGVHTMQKLVLDHRGDVGDEKQTRPLFFSNEEKKAFINPDSFPRFQMLRVTKTDGDGKIEPEDAKECWDTTALDAKGSSLWPNGVYSVNIYAWDIAGNKGVIGAKVQVMN